MNNNDVLTALTSLLNKETPKGISMQFAFENFLQYSKLNCRKDTISYYTNAFKILHKGLDDLNIRYTQQITKSHYKQLETILKAKGYSNTSINKYTDLLKMIFKINYEMEYINDNPIIGIKKLKETKPTIKIISKENLKNIYQYIYSLPNNFLNNRNVLAIFLFNDTGARLTEILNIKIKNISINDNHILLEHVKVGGSRYVFFKNSTKEYINRVLNCTEQNQTYLFQINKDSPMKEDFIYHFLDKISKECNIDQSISPHKWRHTCITHLIEENVNLANVMKVAGHTQFSTTERYIHQSPKSLKEAVLKAL